MLNKSILFLFLFFFTTTHAQSVNELIDLFTNNPNGTARFEAMGGAFGALGGDLSSININPAGSAVFNDNEYGFTIGYEKKVNKTVFFNNQESEDDNKFSFNQGGAVWLLKNTGEGNINKISFGFNAQTNNSFKNNFLVKGRNTLNSIDKFFLNNSSGLNTSDLNVGSNESIAGVYRYLGQNYGFSAQQAFLAYQAYLINFDSDSNQFYSLADYSTGVDQNYISETKGVNTKYNLNLAIQFKENFYFGMNINTHDLYIKNWTSHYENNFSENSAITAINFENQLITQGEGLSFQLGGIAKLKSFRFGITYQSPTWYTLRDETWQSLEVQSIDVDGITYQDIVNPNILNVYPDYKINTPSAITTSAAIVFGKLGLLSIDVISRDFSKAKLKPNNDFSNTNREINTKLTNTTDIRLGGEMRIQNLSLRAGYNKIGSPYKDTVRMQDSDSFSFGFGYDFGETLISFSHKVLKSKKGHQLFDSGLTDLAQINTEHSLTNLSLIFKF